MHPIGDIEELINELKINEVLIAIPSASRSDRFRIIDKMLRNKYKPFPSKKELREACEESLYGSISGDHICDSTIEKDLFNMKMENDAPIKYSKRDSGYYYEDSDYSINDIPLTEDELHSIKYYFR